MNTIICYCFNYTEADIKKDVEQNGGRSLILEKIVTEKQRESCRCQTEHPEGR